MDFAAILLARNGDVSTGAKYSRADVKHQEIYLPLLHSRKQLESIKEPLKEPTMSDGFRSCIWKDIRVILTTRICFQSEL